MHRRIDGAYPAMAWCPDLMQHHDRPFALVGTDGDGPGPASLCPELTILQIKWRSPEDTAFAFQMRSLEVLPQGSISRITPVSPAAHPAARTTDINLLACDAADGDPAAIGAVLELMRPLVVRYCRARIGSRDLAYLTADDVAQEVCLSVLKILPNYRMRGGSFLRLVYAIAANKVTDAVRAAARDRAEPIADVPGLGLLERPVVIPWRQAVSTRFDLILAARTWGVAELDGPVVLMPHGAGSAGSKIGLGSDRHSLHRAHLMRDGQVVPAALALATDDEKLMLAGASLDALPRSVVAGDPSFDRMLAGKPYRDAYRRALGASPGQRVLVATSTWSRHSLFGSEPAVFRLAEELPWWECLVVAVLHPFIWHGYGRRQVLEWLARARELGLVVLPPEEAWRAAVVAAGDHGSCCNTPRASTCRR